MQVEDFLMFLEVNDVGHSTNGKSIILLEAPCCGGHNKIYLHKNDSEPGAPFFGKCMKCETSWNSRSYLVETGFEHEKVDHLHGGVMNLEKFELMAMPVLELLVPLRKEEAEEPVYFSADSFYPISEIPDNEAALYAKKRGWTPSQEDTVMVDVHTNSVVFVVRDGDAVVGWQKRFLRPPNPHMKTQSAPGFRKTRFIMEFPGNGDILICEGPFTALSAWHFGYHGVCTFGAAVSEHQVRLIAELAQKTGKRVGTAFDLDKAGKKGYRTVRMGMHWLGVPTFRVCPETGNDLNDSWMAGKGVIELSAADDDVMIPDLEIEI